MQQEQDVKPRISLEHFQGAVLGSAIGDALGWPTEYGYIHKNRGLQPFYLAPLTSFVPWTQLSLSWSNYKEQIEPGDYSDDTQQQIALARCINDDAQFMPEQFAYAELPFWLQYQRGGGRSSKYAATALLNRASDWQQNFYNVNGHESINAGTNGAAMRNLPIVLVNAADESQLITTSFRQAMITHGHPRALWGTVLIALSLNYLLNLSGDLETAALLNYLQDRLPTIEPLLLNNYKLTDWILRWDEQSRQKTFISLWRESQAEIARLLTGMTRYGNYLDYYKFCGARHPATRGSGISTVCAAIYLFLRYSQKPEQALLSAANVFGSDTDTIGSMLGSLLGAYHGINSPLLPQSLLATVQDHAYLLSLATRLFHLHQSRIAQTPKKEPVLVEKLDRQALYHRMLAWEQNFYQPMLTNIDLVGEQIEHPILGTGIVQGKSMLPITEIQGTIRWVRVNFTSGQSCIFHSAVYLDGKIEESLMPALNANRIS